MTHSVLPNVQLATGINDFRGIQAIVGYCYSAPHPTFGNSFLRFEQASLAVVSPEPVSIFMVRPEHHVTEVTPSAKLTADQWGRVPGYEGRYNFQHPFWAVEGSRLYPPVPNIGLNISQDLAYDLGEIFASPQGQFLPDLL